MSGVNFGSAQLLGAGMSEEVARALLEIAITAGAVRLDTAPLYGSGGCEALVASVASAHPDIGVTTKVGLEPAGPRPAWRRLASGALQRLPARLCAQLRLGRQRSAASAQAAGPSGRFGVDAVRRSVERSLVLFGRIDRLMLHEVHPADISGELLELLRHFRRQGDVGAIGVATGNAVSAEALRRAGGLFTVAHVSIDPLGPPAPDRSRLPAVRWVGHGALGAEGRTLAHVLRRLQTSPALSERWRAAVSGTAFEGADGCARGLLAMASARADELLVATRQPQRVPAAVLAASGVFPLPPAARAVLNDTLQPAARWPSTTPGT